MNLLLVIEIILIVIFKGINTTSLDCWDVKEHAQYKGVLEKYPYETKDGCLNLCMNMPQCNVVNIELLKNSYCLVQKDLSDVNFTALKPTNFVYNFFLNRTCKNLPSLNMNCWTIKKNSVYNGLSKGPVFDLISCLNLCLSLPQCGVINFYSGSVYPCWVQDQYFTIKRSAITESLSTTTYLLDRTCLLYDNYGILKYHQKCRRRTVNHYYAGLDRYDAGDVSLCFTICIGVPQCQVFDFSKPGNCFIQTAASPFNKNSLKPRPKVDNYALDRNCYDQIFQEGHFCWIITQRYNYPDLQETPYTDIFTCLAYCELIPQCGVIDFNAYATAKCFVQTKHFEPTLKDLRPHPDVTNSLLDRRCYNATLNVDLSCWYVQNRFKYKSGLTGNYDVDNLYECLAYCETLENCHIMDFDFVTRPKCRVQLDYLDIDLKNLTPNESGITFILKQECYC